MGSPESFLQKQFKRSAEKFWVYIRSQSPENLNNLPLEPNFFAPKYLDMIPPTIMIRVFDNAECATTLFDLTPAGQASYLSFQSLDQETKNNIAFLFGEIFIRKNAYDNNSFFNPLTETAWLTEVTTPAMRPAVAEMLLAIGRKLEADTTIPKERKLERLTNYYRSILFFVGASYPNTVENVFSEQTLEDPLTTMMVDTLNTGMQRSSLFSSVVETALDEQNDRTVIKQMYQETLNDTLRLEDTLHARFRDGFAPIRTLALAAWAQPIPETLDFKREDEHICAIHPLHPENALYSVLSRKSDYIVEIMLPYLRDVVDRYTEKTLFHPPAEVHDILQRIFFHMAYQFQWQKENWDTDSHASDNALATQMRFLGVSIGQNEGEKKIKSIFRRTITNAIGGYNPAFYSSWDRILKAFFLITP